MTAILWAGGGLALVGGVTVLLLWRLLRWHDSLVLRRLLGRMQAGDVGGGVSMPEDPRRASEVRDLLLYAFDELEELDLTWCAGQGCRVCALMTRIDTTLGQWKGEPMPPGTTTERSTNP